MIPFIHFGIQSRYWYRPDTVKKWDIILMIGAAALGVIVMLNVFYLEVPNAAEYRKLGLLHLAPLVLSILIVSEMRIGGIRIPTKPRAPTAKHPKEQASYHPIPSRREIEHLTWDDLVIPDSLREELISVVELLKDPNTAHRYGIEAPKGILLDGPPGTGKTSIAKVIANTARLSFFALKADEIVSKWVGESEKNLSALFKAAQKHAPAVIFIDEIDSIGKMRSGGQQWAENLLNHLLQLIDGVVKTEGLYIIGATNRSDLVDTALKRSGRLNKVIEVPLPDFNARVKIFTLYLSRLHLADDIDLGELATITETKSGADIKEICNQAGLNAFKRESGQGSREYLVTRGDLQQALTEFL